MRHKISELRLDPSNARRHSPVNLRAIADSLSRFGQVLPIVVSSDGLVIGGNGTVEAARQIGWDEIDATIFDGSPDQAKALAIALNRSAELAEWDVVQLEATLSDLHDVGYAPEVLGFSDYDIERMFPTPRMPTHPDTEEVPVSQIDAKKAEAPPQYLLLFDDPDQEKRFLKWAKRLKKDFGADTVAEAIDRHIAGE